MKNSLNKISVKLRKQLAVLGLISLGLLLPACTDNADVTEGNNAENDISVDEILEDTPDYLGETVTVDGEVEETVGISAFILEEEEGFGDDNRLLVINPVSATTSIVEEEDVQVTGEVRQFVLADLERDYDLGWDLDLQRKLEVEFAGKPVIVARYIEEL